jgi:hypothetical protein
MEVEQQRGDLRAPVRAALALVRPQAAAKGIALDDQTGDAEAVYLGDEARVRQIVVNLLSNAVKFTDPDGRVTARCGTREARPVAATNGTNGTNGTSGAVQQGPWAFVRVEDTGIGIPPDRLESIFEPFVQVDARLTRAESGSGLGLAISRQFARLMGGDLVAESRVGEGSAFTLWLPAAGAVRAPARAAANGAAPGSATLPKRRRSVGLGAVGEQLSAGPMTDIMQAAADRLRADPATPMARDLTDAELEDHIAYFLADLAQALTALGEVGKGDAGEAGEAGALALLRDGSAIQRLIAERHGALRRRLGWTEEALAREYEILREEVERVLRRSAPVGAEHALAESRLVIRQLLERAEAISRRGFREASAPERAGAQF